MSGILKKKSIDIVLSAAEDKNPNAVAVCHTSWHLPVYKQTLTYCVASSRRATATEEYIMKAAGLDLSFPIDTTMLPNLLGLDEVFIDDATDRLAEKGILDTDALPVLKLTESGKRYLASVTVPDEERSEKIEYYIERKSATVYAAAKDEPKLGMHPSYAHIEDKCENVKKIH